MRADGAVPTTLALAGRERKPLVLCFVCAPCMCGVRSLARSTSGDSRRSSDAIYNRHSAAFAYKHDRTARNLAPRSLRKHGSNRAEQYPALFRSSVRSFVRSFGDAMRAMPRSLATRGIHDPRNMRYVRRWHLRRGKERRLQQIGRHKAAK